VEERGGKAGGGKGGGVSVRDNCSVLGSCLSVDRLSLLRKYHSTTGVCRKCSLPYLWQRTIRVPVAVCCRVLQCVAVMSGSVLCHICGKEQLEFLLQCVAVCCSVLQ